MSFESRGARDSSLTVGGRWAVSTRWRPDGTTAAGHGTGHVTLEVLLGADDTIPPRRRAPRIRKPSAPDAELASSWTHSQPESPPSTSGRSQHQAARQNDAGLPPDVEMRRLGKRHGIRQRPQRSKASRPSNGAKGSRTPERGNESDSTGTAGDRGRALNAKLLSHVLKGRT